MNPQVLGTLLLGGVAAWLFGHMRNAGIEPPADLSLRSVLGVVLQILDITAERIFLRLARRVGQEVVDRLRAALEWATGVWSWVAALVTEGPAGLWREVRERLSNLWDMVLDGVIGWVTRTIIQRVAVKLLTMLDPSGVMAVVNSLIALYRAIQSFARYLREMLEIVGRVADWAGGPLQAMAWYRAEPLPGFGDRPAESLVKDGKAAAVRDHLDRVALGGFAGGSAGRATGRTIRAGHFRHSPAKARVCWVVVSTQLALPPSIFP